MNTLSVLAIGRAAGTLAQTLNKRVTIRVNDTLAEIVDDNGLILDYGMDSPNLCKRMRSRREECTLDDLLGV